MITRATEMVTAVRDRFMIHALLHNGVCISALSNLQAIIGKRATLITVDDFILVASQFAETERNSIPLQHQIKDFRSLVNDLHGSFDILPFRFGTIATIDELVKTVRENQHSYRTCLHAITGFTELNLRWAVMEDRADIEIESCRDSEKAGTEGFEYLKSKLISKKLSCRVEDELRAIAENFTNRFRDQEIKWQSSVGKLNVKNSCQNEDRYVIARLELLVGKEVALSILHEGANVFLRSEKPAVASGPWPPYSFIELGNIDSSSQQMQRCAITFPYEAVS